MDVRLGTYFEAEDGCFDSVRESEHKLALCFLALVAFKSEEVAAYAVPVVVHSCLVGLGLGGLQQAQ